MLDPLKGSAYCSRITWCDCFTQQSCDYFMRLLDAITRDCLMRLFIANCQNQYYDNFTRASARWKLKNYGNYGNFCRFFMKYYDYYEYFFQKMIIENRPQWSWWSQLPNPPCPKEGFNLFPNPFPLQGKGLTAPTRRSDIKVCSTRSKGRHIAHASLDAIVLRNKVAIILCDCLMRLLAIVWCDYLLRIAKTNIMIILPVRPHDGN